jgi:hypothetical protein
MSVTIVANDIPSPMHPHLYEAKIREALRETTDGCQVFVVKLDDPFGVGVTIVRAKGNWCRKFIGLEAKPEIIRRAIEDTVLLLD